MDTFSEKQRAFWEKHTNLRTYDHPVVQTFAKQRIKLITELIGNTAIESALDVGCGDGFGMYSMQQIVSYICGCDSSLEMLRNNPIDRRLLCQADIYALPFADASFDLVYCWELLHHIHDPVQAVKELARVSRRYILVFEPNSLNLPMALFGIAVPAERGLLRFTPWYLKRLLMQAGVQPVQMLTGGCFTPNRTPRWLFSILKRMPYKWPFVGISNVVLAEKSLSCVPKL